MEQAPKKKNYGLWFVLNAVCAAWIVYDITTANEVPSMALMMLQWVLLAGTVAGAVGCVAMLMKESSGN